MTGKSVPSSHPFRVVWEHGNNGLLPKRNGKDHEMRNGEAGKMLGVVLLQIYEKEGKIKSERDEKNWRVWDEAEIKELRDQLLRYLHE